MSVAFSEPQSRFDLNDVITSAKKDGDNYILDGYKAVVMNGPSQIVLSLLQEHLEISLIKKAYLCLLSILLPKEYL